MRVTAGTQVTFKIGPKDAPFMKAPTQITPGMATPDDLFRRLS